MADFPISGLPSESLTDDSLLLGSMPDGNGGYDSGKFEASEMRGVVVKNITQAAYDSLSPAEQNNGAIYLTDGVVPEKIANAFDSSASYAVGDLCIYNNALYRFTATKTAGAWDSTKITVTTLDAEKMRHITDLPSASAQTPPVTISSTDSLAIDHNGTEYKASIADVGGVITDKFGLYVPSTTGTVNIFCNGNYRTFIINGMFQDIGALTLLVSVSNGSVDSVINLVTNSAFSNQNLTFSFSDLTLHIAAKNGSYFEVLSPNIKLV